MTVALGAPEIAPIVATLETVGEQRGAAVVHGVTPGLVVADRAGWTPAERFTSGEALPGLIAAAEARWGASPAAAAALAWKSYVYWLTLPAVAAP